MNLSVGDQIEVHVAFNDSWSGGFEVGEVLTDGYRVRRTLDGALLPEATGEGDVRPVLVRATWADVVRPAGSAPTAGAPGTAAR